MPLYPLRNMKILFLGVFVVYPHGDASSTAAELIPADPNLDPKEYAQLLHQANETVLEGDILRMALDEPLISNFRDPGAIATNSAFIEEIYHWPDGIVPYVIGSGPIMQQNKRAIREAMEEMENVTCVKFVTRSTDKPQRDFIYIASPGLDGAKECKSYIGRLGRGAQLVILSPHCFAKVTIQHELMHALGFMHEHSRLDRDDYVEILSENIKPGMEAGNFRKHDSKTVTAFGLPYDFDSIMHYGSDFMQKDGVSVGPTIRARPKYANRQFGSKQQMSDLDIRKINLLYKCQTQLEPGQSLVAGQSLWSLHKTTELRMQSDGNLVLYRRCDGLPIWSSTTHRLYKAAIPTSVTMMHNGNLAMYSAGVHLSWSSGTNRRRLAGAALRVLDEGSMCLYKDGKCLWKSGGVSQCELIPSPSFENARVILQPGEKMVRGQSFLSAARTCSLTFRADGDLVLTRTCDGAETWSIKHGVGHAMNLGMGDAARISEFGMGADGNLNMFDANGEQRWFQNTLSNGAGATLRLADDCQMCIFKNGSCRWTAHALAYECPDTSQGKLIERDVDFPCGDIDHFKVDSEDLCFTRCNAIERCTAAVFIPSRQECWLKNHTNCHATISRDRVLYRKTKLPGGHPTLQQGANYPCGDVEALGDVASKDTCWQRCEQLEECIGAVVFVPWKMCWLKSRLDSPNCAIPNNTKEGEWTYVKGAVPGPFPLVEIGMDYPCGDVARFEGVQTEEECWSKCDVTASGCIVASYGDKTCWLKSRKYGGVKSTDRVSYVKYSEDDGQGGSCL
ncbi:putative Zinc metalloproteinase nas-14 [Hypsibius exemplaris]|uniref:Metalloendopeptidase n=1 Tax=Hypsibius exemplaris TaxID=2072580 RepID=A0A1W0X8W3_HYPEX|nr:putative Zinc metalloproteinase nas-14 [Hypsibius exemplaris]